MSGGNSPNPEQEFATNARNLMLHRARRLVRLIKLGAPDLILCNEAKLLYTMLPLLGESYKSFTSHETDWKIKIQKNKLGFCAKKDCFKNLLRVHLDTTDGNHLCKECRHEQNLKDKDLK